MKATKIKRHYRWLSIFLIIVMLLTMVPAQVGAQELANFTEPVAPATAIWVEWQPQAANFT